MRLPLNQFLQSEIIMQISSSVQNNTHITAVFEKKIKCNMYICSVAFQHFNLCFKLNIFFSLLLFFPGIYKRREKKLTKKTIKYKLGGSSKMWSIFFPSKTFKTFFRKLSILFKFLMTQQVGGGGGGWSCYLHHYHALRTKIDMWVIPKISL